MASGGDAQAAGIATVHQYLALAPLMSIARNFALGREPGPAWRLDLGAARAAEVRGLAGLGIPLGDPDRPVGSLSGGQRQCVAIAGALDRGARVLILDEPTSALGVHQASVVLDAARRAVDRGIAVLLVTHDLDHACGGGPGPSKTAA